MKIIFMIFLFLTQISAEAQVFNYFNMDTTRSKNFIVLKPKEKSVRENAKILAVYAFFDHSLYLRSFEFVVPKNDPNVPLSNVLSLEKELLNYVEALKKVSVKDFGYAEKPEKFRLGIMRFKVLN